MSSRQSSCRLMCAVRICCWRLRPQPYIRWRICQGKLIDHACRMACVAQWLRLPGAVSWPRLAGDTVPGMDADCDDCLPLAVRALWAGAGALRDYGDVSLVSGQPWRVAPLQL